MKSFTIFPQPTEALGTRKRLVNRKGEVDPSGVEHAYSGIVNVYALVPPGATTTIEEVSAGVMSRPLTATQWPQKKIKQKQFKTIESPLDSFVYYGWKVDKNDKKNALYKIDKNGKYVHGGKATLPEYVRWMASHIDQVKFYDETDPNIRFKIKNAIAAIAKYPINSPQRETMIFKEAMNLQVPVDTMISWLDNPLYAPPEGKVHKTQNDIDHIIRLEMLEADNINNPKARKILKDQYKLTDNDIDIRLKELDNKHGITIKNIKRYITENMLKKKWVESNKPAINHLKSTYNLNDDQITAYIKASRSEYTEPGGLKEERIVVDTSTLPLDISKVQIPRLSSKPLNNDIYLPIPGSEAKDLYQQYSKNPNETPVAYLDEGAGITYYKNRNKLTRNDSELVIATERKRKLNRIGIKRISYRLKKSAQPKKRNVIVKKKPLQSKSKVCVKKCSKSSIIKKSLLSKLKCKCGGKRK